LNDITRYDQELAEQLQHLPTPPEDFAWAEMKKLLEEDDDDRVIIPFYRRWGCLVLGLLAGLLLAGGAWWYWNNKQQDSRMENNNTSTIVSSRPENKSGNTSAIQTVDTVKLSNDSSTQAGDASVANEVSGSQPITAITQGATLVGEDGQKSSQQPVSGNEINTGRKTRANGSTKTTWGAAGVSNNTSDGNTRTNSKKRKTGPKTAMNVSGGNLASENPGGESSAKKPAELTLSGKSPIEGDEPAAPGNPAAPEKPAAKNENLPLKPSVVAVKDSSSKPVKSKTDSLPVQQKAGETTPDKQKKNDWTVAAGLSIYQPIPLDGESSVPYNFYGRKGTLSDYIPSAYLRLYRNDKWFVHGEFRYGAPQTVKPFEYKKEIIDSTPVMSITANFRLKKTYYHQVPFSIHYFVLPKLSVGAGVIFNRFTGALADKDIYRRGGGQIDTLLSSALVKEKNDTRFAANHLQWSAEINYNWKRFFIGGRFSRDINPFIKYTDPTTGAPVEKKLQALNVFLRYDLWRSKKKSP
jgi:hypothetical protein